MYNTMIQHNRKFRTGVPSLGISFLLFICFSVLCNVHLMAQGNLLVYPLRIVFEGQKRTMDVSIANIGQDSAKYSISFLQYRTNEDGAYETITTPDPGQNFADKNIRFYPRSVKLGPNESQTVKLQLTKLELLEPGEYRSHLYFRSLPNQKVLGAINPIKDTESYAIKIVPIFGITIPVIIKVGESTTSLKITDLKFETGIDGTKKLLLSINRIGNMSAFGDISVSHVDLNGKETKIGLVKGVAIYTPTKLRRMKVDIDNKSTDDFSKGAIHVLFSSQSDKHPEKLAEAELLL